MIRLSQLLMLALLSLLGACAGLPPRGEPAASTAYRDTAGTALARIAAASRPAGETAPSGFRLLPSGEFAFNARVALAQRAERSLDLQCYHIQRDEAGRMLLRALRDAAQRGVRVRLLVDDFYAAEIDDLLLGLAAHPNIELRLFNPLPLRRGAPIVRLLLSPGNFQQMNHRMHNKLFIADNAAAIYGGRNIADEYFMGHREANFIDMDVLSTGQVVDELSTVFDRYWNSEVAWPLQALLPPPEDAAQARAAFDEAVRDAKPVMPRYRLDPLGHTPVEAQLSEGRLVQAHASAKVHADPPEKATVRSLLNKPTAAMQGLLDTMQTARRYVAMTSPYFLPNDAAMQRMRYAGQNGVKLVLVTNSLGSTDEPLVHDHYSRRRIEMLKMGIDIYEFSPTHAQRSLGFGSFGQSVPRLHAKVAIVDHRHVLVGSVNLDARSAIGNTELGVVIDSPPLAEDLSQLVTGRQFANMYKLRLADDGERIEWLSTEADGRITATSEEPAGSAWLRFKLWLLSLVVDERLL
ncbi:phospholipase D family protein [Aquincola sp. S2]|uniref:Phospholipase D family protein n=1 Tax=Pseudaquabacterium terrae TaxID=2732868 RepID=A0ABX2EJI7_9BURK|nr:phospholipase D family protein [Aquabacterium terrae]NRF68778.1 phospholipase D family protein [Aquabacterium terrae]